MLIMSLGHRISSLFEMVFHFAIYLSKITFQMSFSFFFFCKRHDILVVRSIKLLESIFFGSNKSLFDILYSELVCGKENEFYKMQICTIEEKLTIMTTNFISPMYQKKQKQKKTNFYDSFVSLSHSR